MKLVSLIDEDFLNYKKVSMNIGCPKCSFKCEKECGIPVCHNNKLAKAKVIDIDDDKLIDRYLNNSISKSIVFQGLEPFDSFSDLYSFIYRFTEKCDDDIVIYTGYNKDEVFGKVEDLLGIIESNTLIIKYGRFIPNQKPHFDDVLGVNLASDNQYAEKYN